MSENKIDSIDRTVHKTYVWLKELQEEINIPDQQFAYQGLRSVLHTLRDRLMTEEAVKLGAQMPMLIRGLYFEGYKPANKPKVIRDREEFLQRISNNIEAGVNVDPQSLVSAVFHVLERHISKGEFENVVTNLPKQWSNLWERQHHEGE